MRTFHVVASRNSYLISRPLCSDGEWATHWGEPMDFTETELVRDPWETIEDVPPAERGTGPFALTRQFRGSTWIFHRDGIEYRVMWCDLHIIVDGVDCGMTGTQS